MGGSGRVDGVGEDGAGERRGEGEGQQQEDSQQVQSD